MLAQSRMVVNHAINIMGGLKPFLWHQLLMDKEERPRVSIANSFCLHGTSIPGLLGGRFEMTIVWGAQDDTFLTNVHRDESHLRVLLELDNQDGYSHVLPATPICRKRGFGLRGRKGIFNICGETSQKSLDLKVLCES